MFVSKIACPEWFPGEVWLGRKSQILSMKLIYSFIEIAGYGSRQPRFHETSHCRRSLRSALLVWVLILPVVKWGMVLSMHVYSS